MAVKERKMGINWDMVFCNEKKQFERMTETEKFIYFLLLQYNSPYGWGKENPESSDCSGAVCLALYAATGLLIRTTADDLYRRVFTVKNPGCKAIRAAFFITGKDKAHVDRIAQAGTATHVTGLIDDGVILNSQEPGARVQSLEGLSRWFKDRGTTTVVRGLDRGALARLARDGNTRYGLDGEFSHYFDMGA
jgi:murein DD-endopeptidase